MKEIERNNKKDRNANEKKEAVDCKKSTKGMLFGQKKRNFCFNKILKFYIFFFKLWHRSVE